MYHEKELNLVKSEVKIKEKENALDWKTTPKDMKFTRYDEEKEYLKQELNQKVKPILKNSGS